MYKVIFESESTINIDKYIRQYTSYYEDLYCDSGIWSENQIIESYRSEWYDRYDEIIDTMVHTLQNDIISYVNHETIVRWRTKVLIVKFRYEWKNCIVTHIEIR